MGKRALIIGNSEYPNTYRLANPENDAKALKDVFEKIGIVANLCINLDKASFLKTIKDFSDEVSSEHLEAIIFFFAGHGIQIENKIFLCPTDFDFANARNSAIGRTDRKYQAQLESIDLDTIIDEISNSGTETRIFILDSCRNNPIDSTRGLETTGAISVLAPKGTLIEFSTSPGQVASDSAFPGSEHSAFTDALLSIIYNPGMKIEEIFKKTRVLLNNNSGGKQVSWEHSSLIGDLVLFENETIGSYSIAYSQLAKADEFYKPEGDQEVLDMIESLKSHNWYKQNAVIPVFIQSCLVQKDISINDLFVIGRNLYQAACGNAFEIVNFFKNLSTNLKQIGEKYAFHLMNGILFEICFDKRGSLRSPANYKIGNNHRDVVYQYPISYVEDNSPSLNKDYIQRQLFNYSSRIFFISESDSNDFELTLNYSYVERPDSEGEVKPFITTVTYKSNNILFSAGGMQTIDIETEKFNEMFFHNVVNMMYQLILCPDHKLHFISQKQDKTINNLDIVYFPRDFQIRKAPSMSFNQAEDIKSWYYM